MKKTHASSLFIRVGLTAVILAAVAVTALNFSLLKHKLIDLQARLTAQTAARVAAEDALSKTKNNLVATAAALQSTRAALDATTAEKEQALAAAASHKKQAEKLAGELVATAKDRDDAQAYLARYKATTFEPEQVLQAAGLIKALRNDLAAAQKENKGLTAKVKMLLGSDKELGIPVPLPADLTARVIAADPKWHFIVLDVGEDQGVLLNGEVLVSRQGKLLGKAKVSRVQPGRCVANMMPGWEFGEIAEGDQVIPAVPRS
jgi:hypothetical protein